jgi:hypothetical protein
LTTSFLAYKKGGIFACKDLLNAFFVYTRQSSIISDKVWKAFNNTITQSKTKFAELESRMAKVR